MAKLNQFKAPALIVNGEGAVKSELGALAKGYGKKALIVTDSNLETLGLLEDVKSGLSAAGIRFDVYNKVVTEPTMVYAQEGVQCYAEAKAEFLIAASIGLPPPTAIRNSAR
jgi:alcohol dehydrogenase class IV